MVSLYGNDQQWQLCVTNHPKFRCFETILYYHLLKFCGLNGLSCVVLVWGLSCVWSQVSAGLQSPEGSVGHDILCGILPDMKSLGWGAGVLVNPSGLTKYLPLHLVCLSFITVWWYQSSRIAYMVAACPRIFQETDRKLQGCLGQSLRSHITSLVPHSTGYSQVTESVPIQGEGTTLESGYWGPWFIGGPSLETSCHSCLITFWIDRFSH